VGVSLMRIWSDLCSSIWWSCLSLCATAVLAAIFVRHRRPLCCPVLCRAGPIFVKLVAVDLVLHAVADILLLCGRTSWCCASPGVLWLCIAFVLELFSIDRDQARYKYC
jgi:hypothetical protein